MRVGSGNARILWTLAVLIFVFTVRAQSIASGPSDVIIGDVAAQDAGDWDAYLDYRTDAVGAPERISSYRNIWRAGEGIRGNVVAAHIESMAQVPFEVARECVGVQPYMDALRSPIAYYVIINYTVRNEDKYVSNGANPRLYILDLIDQR